MSYAESEDTVPESEDTVLGERLCERLTALGPINVKDHDTFEKHLMIIGWVSGYSEALDRMASMRPGGERILKGEYMPIFIDLLYERCIAMPEEKIYHVIEWAYFNTEW